MTWTAGSAVATGTVTTAPPPGGLTVFGEFRTRVAATLQAAVDAAGLTGDVTVVADVVDAVVPPAYLLVWPQADDWLIPMTNCADTTRLDVILVGGRFEPSGGVEHIETLVALALPALRAGHLPVPRVAGPGRFDIGGVAYLAAELTLSVPLAVGGP